MSQYSLILMTIYVFALVLNTRVGISARAALARGVRRLRLSLPTYVPPKLSILCLIRRNQYDLPFR